VATIRTLVAKLLQFCRKRPYRRSWHIQLFISLCGRVPSIRKYFFRCRM